MLNGIVCDTWGDLTHALRSLRKSPGFTLTAILTLALGIGANSAIFNVVNALLLASLPVTHPERLIEISTIDSKGEKHGFSIPALELFAKNTSTVSGLFAWVGGGMETMELKGTLIAGSADEVAGDYYGVLGIQPALGRFLTHDDTNAAVLGFDTWDRYYHRDPGAIGKTLTINAKPFTIVGVHPKTFTGLIREVDAQATIPVTNFDRDASYFTIIGRLRDHTSAAQARAEFETMWPAIRQQTAPSKDRDAYLSGRIQIEPAAQGVSYLRQRFTKPLYLLTAIVAILLLLACVNLANVALARAHGRTSEYAIRAALGASRWRLARASLAEAALLAIFGAIPGFAFAFWSSRYLAAFIWTGYGRMALPLEPDLRIALFNTAIAAATAMLFGFFPAWRAGRHFSQVAGARVTRNNASRALVAIQVALSFAIICAALLFGRSLGNLLNRNPGFAADRLLVAQLFPRTTYAGLDKPPYYRQLIETVSRIPGVASASFASNRPIGFLRKETVLPFGISADFQLIAPGYFTTVGISLLEGRDFNFNDSASRPKVAIVSASLATHIGQHVKIAATDYEIVGVVRDAERDPRVTSLPSVYAMIFQQPKFLAYPAVVIRTPGDPALLSHALREQVESLGREYPLQIDTVREEVDRSLIVERTLALLGGFFGAAALLLAAVGLYGLLSYNVSRRTPEIGIRMALGATRSGITWLIAKEVAALLALGLFSGLALALAGTRAASSLLYGLSAQDPSTMLLAALALILISLLASLIPSRRAAAIDPAVALRRD
jgi:predicted permease